MRCLLWNPILYLGDSSETGCDSPRLGSYKRGLRFQNRRIIFGFVSQSLSSRASVTEFACRSAERGRGRGGGPCELTKVSVSCFHMCSIWSVGTEDGGGVGKAETTNKSNPKTVKPAHLYHAGNVACVYRLKLMHRHFSMKLKCTDLHFTVLKTFNSNSCCMSQAHN